MNIAYKVQTESVLNHLAFASWSANVRITERIMRETDASEKWMT